MKFALRLVSGFALFAAASLAFAAPRGLDAGVTPLSKLVPLIMQAVDVNAAKAAPRNKPLPLRFALPLNVDYTPDKAGEWETLADGRLMWRALVQSANASSLNFGFTRYHLPAGAEMYIYSSSGDDVRGPYTAAGNALGQLWTPVIHGSEAVIEVTLPAAVRDQLDLRLTKVNHGFLEFWKAGAVEKSGSCNVDVACPQGDGWRDDIRAVARYTIGGQFLCSGQLINNTRLDFTPYFLTAHHCVGTAEEAASTVYYWNYQASGCGSGGGSLSQSQSGASLVATYEPSDFTLMQLAQKPDSTYKVYYSGWSYDTVAPKGVTCIHHPAGDEKRITYSDRQTVATSYGGTGAGDSTHLQIPRWDSGTTEGGSSGSGLWDASHHLVGQLHGGNAACDTPDGSDWFGRFAVSWTGGGKVENSLQPTLDPLKSSAMFLDGADPAAPKVAVKSAAVGGKYGGGIPLLSLCLLAGAALLRKRGK